MPMSPKARCVVSELGASMATMVCEPWPTWGLSLAQLMVWPSPLPVMVMVALGSSLAQGDQPSQALKSLSRAKTWAGGASTTMARSTWTVLGSR